MKNELDTKVNVYITENGDTWDKVSYKVYGHGRMAAMLFHENPDFSSVVIFEDGVMLICPEEKRERSKELPEWIS
ncbi:MAG: tail protein X [Fusobacterium necrophorum]|uniref:tail protein X n=1 Tax=Fusobacterium necrophorum TaxID=859 RepID=UPI001012238D|nr:tail protein X [Fusobacterium necrophorum]MDY2573601.1 tail protein X [Fusobacterium necrophorum]MDY6173216.1 tail protein X [Fusobacterium necrophorum]RXZ26625.1 phage tail protein [Fusobacterium necrophorum]